MVATAALCALAAACSSPVREKADARRPLREMTEAERTRIPVVKERPPGRELRELGKVEWPPKDMFMLFAVACNPAHLRRVAVEAHGREVDAIVDYREWKDGVQPKCGGTAVAYDE